MDARRVPRWWAGKNPADKTQIKRSAIDPVKAPKLPKTAGELHGWMHGVSRDGGRARALQIKRRSSAPQPTQSKHPRFPRQRRGPWMDARRVPRWCAGKGPADKAQIKRSATDPVKAPMLPKKPRTPSLLEQLTKCREQEAAGCRRRTQNRHPACPRHTDPAEQHRHPADRRVVVCYRLSVCRCTCLNWLTLAAAISGVRHNARASPPPRATGTVRYVVAHARRNRIQSSASITEM